MNGVSVTGMGVISTVGNDIDSFWRACLGADSNVETIPEAWLGYNEYNSGIWSPLSTLDFDVLGFKKSEITRRDPVSLIALAAAHQAIQQAGIELDLVNERQNQYALTSIDSERIGVFMGTGIGGAYTFLHNQAYQMLKIPKRELMEFLNGHDIETSVLESLVYPRVCNRFTVSMLMPNAVSAALGLRYGIHGPNRTITHACAAGTTAIASAYRAIQAGEVDIAICGGAEYLYDDYGGIYRGFDILQTLANPLDPISASNRPFDQDRSGFLYSQGGAGVLVLESAESCQRRGSRPLAEIVGCAETFDAHSMVAIAEDGKQIERMMTEAVSSAGLQLQDIDYINTHGTGTQTNDLVEASVIDRLFGNKPLVNSSKSILGHSIGASGALEAIISILSLRNQTTHICNNLQNPLMDLNFVQQVAPQSISHVMSQSFAFGGHNSALVFKAADS